MHPTHTRPHTLHVLVLLRAYHAHITAHTHTRARAHAYIYVRVTKHILGKFSRGKLDEMCSSFSYPRVRQRATCDTAAIASSHDATADPLRPTCSSTGRIAGTSAASTAASRPRPLGLFDNVVQTHFYLINHLHLCGSQWNVTITQENHRGKPTSLSLSFFAMMAAAGGETKTKPRNSAAEQSGYSGY